MLFSHVYVTLDPFWASYCDQVINMKLFLFFSYPVLVCSKRQFDLMIGSSIRC